jgi:hypothetical protein
MKLSKNFTLEEFLVSQTAERHGIDMTPPEDIVENLQELVRTCMQPLRDAVGESIWISSGYRPPALNTLIGGSATSAHPDGRACDFKVRGQTPYDTCKLVEALELPYDQVIHEFARWVHLGIAEDPRGQELTAHRHQGRTRYVFGIMTLEEAAKL